jgi:hypothetical protein
VSYCGIRKFNNTLHSLVVVSHSLYYNSTAFRATAKEEVDLRSLHRQLLLKLIYGYPLILFAGAMLDAGSALGMVGREIEAVSEGGY